MQPLLSLLAMLPVTYCMTAFVGLVVPLKWRQFYPISYVTVSGILWIINNMILAHNIVLLDTLNVFAIFLLLMIVAPKGKRFQAMMAQVFLFFTMTMGDFLIVSLITPVFNAMGYSPDQMMDRGNSINAIGCLAASIVTCPMLYGCVRLLRRNLPVLNASSDLAVFLIIPASQILLINSLIHYVYLYMEHYCISHIPVDVIMIMVLSIGAVVAFLLLYQKFHRDEMVRFAAKQAETQLDLQSQYYRDIQDSILSVNQIRHDLNNQLQAAYYLLAQGQADQVQQQLDLIQDSLRQRVGTKYCENMMVDAVLCEKARHCQELGIELQLSVFLPAWMPIENAHLCSLFANLLDNAISAVRELGSGKISIQAELQGKMLTIFCRNPSRPPKKKTAARDLLRQHGLGLEILSQLAARYGGHVDTEFQDGLFETAVILRLPDKTE